MSEPCIDTPGGTQTRSGCMGASCGLRKPRARCCTLVCYQSRLENEWIKSSPAKKDLGCWWVRAWPRVRAAQKAKCVLGCIKKGGVLNPVLGSSAQGHQPVEASPEEATKLIRGMEHPSYKKRLGVGAAQPGERQLCDDLIMTFQYLKGPTGELERDL